MLNLKDFPRERIYHSGRCHSDGKQKTNILYLGKMTKSPNSRMSKGGGSVL